MKKKRKEVWEKPIPRKQERKLSVCPKCGQKFYFWQYASKHAKEKGHYGCYVYEKKEGGV